MMDGLIGGFKSMISGRNTTAPNNSTGEPSLAEIRSLVTSKKFEALANCLGDLCGPYGHAQIVEFNGNLQIQLFFDSEMQRALFKQDLEEDFGNWHDDRLTFEDFQTQPEPQHGHLYPLKLKASQSTTLLHKHDVEYDFAKSKNILREIKKHLDSKNNTLLDNTVAYCHVDIQPSNPLTLVTTNTKIDINSPDNIFIPWPENHISIINFCSWLPLSTVWNYAKTCHSMFQFVMTNNDFWAHRMNAHQIPALPSVPVQISSRSQVMGNFALEKAKFFDKQYSGIQWDEGKLANAAKAANWSNAAKYYILAAEQGVSEAIDWLEAALLFDDCSNYFDEKGQLYESCGDVDAKALVTNYTTLKGEMRLALGDTCGITNPHHVFVMHYGNALQHLKIGALGGGVRAIQVLSDRSVGPIAASENHQYLEGLLKSQTTAASKQGADNKDAINWILSVFSDPTKLPTYYKEKTEQALLAAVSGIKFYEQHHSVFNLFRYEKHEYDPVRSLIQAKLNKLLGTELKPIAFHFEATSHNHNQVLIRPTNPDDSDRFIAAIKRSPLAPFFAESICLSRGYAALTFNNSILLTEKSWDHFKALICK